MTERPTLLGPALLGATVAIVLLLPARSLGNADLMYQCAGEGESPGVVLQRCTAGGPMDDVPFRPCSAELADGDLVFRCPEGWSGTCMLFAGALIAGLFYEGVDVGPYDPDAVCNVHEGNCVPVVCVPTGLTLSCYEPAHCPVPEGLEPTCTGTCEPGVDANVLMADVRVTDRLATTWCDYQMDLGCEGEVGEFVTSVVADGGPDGDSDADSDSDGDGSDVADGDAPIDARPNYPDGMLLHGGGSFGCSCRAAARPARSGLLGMLARLLFGL